MILVSGATGTVGRALVNELNSANVPFRALVRDTAKAQSWKQNNVELVQGDFDNPASLEAALTGVERAFMLPPFTNNAAELQANFIDAAKAAGVKHIVKLSVLDASLDSPASLIRGHAEGEKFLAESGLAGTNLRANGFNQNLLQYTDAIKSAGQFYQPAGNARISFVDVRDIAAVAARVLTEAGHEGKNYDITGPEAVDFHEVAREISNAIGKPVQYVDITFDQLRGAMAGAPEWMVQSIVELFEQYHAGYGSRVSNDVEKITGRPAISVAQFARDFASAFKS